MAGTRGKSGTPTGTMTGSERMRRAPRPATQCAATAVKALAVATSATVAAVALTFVMAGPAAAGAQVPRQASPAAAKVKYYIVPPPGHGSVPTLYSIAAATLGNGSLFMEIFDLNKGRLQPNGKRLENPHSVEPGWILLLPPGASGPGVHFGPLPATAKATSRVVHQHAARSQVTAVAGPAAASAGYGSGTLVETVIGGALLVFAAAGLGLVVRRRRRVGGGGRRPGGSSRRAGGSSRRPPSHAREDDGSGGDWVHSLATDAPDHAAGPGGAAISAGGHRWPPADHPSWPANNPGRPVRDPRHPVNDPRHPVGDPGRQAGHPRHPVADPGRQAGTAVGYGRTTGSDSPGWRYSDHPSW